MTISQLFQLLEDWDYILCPRANCTMTNKKPSVNVSYLTEATWHRKKGTGIRRLGWDKISLRQESQSAGII